MELLRISGKRLGYLALPDACERCFWLQSHLGWRLPFSIFAGIFSSIDSYTKKVTAAHYTLRRNVPDWLGIDGEPIQVPHHSRFQSILKRSGILLTGAPDELLRRFDGSLAILDYKTSRFTEHQDQLLPTYRTQLNAYALISHNIGLGQVSGLYLVYCEPLTGLDDEDIIPLIDEDGFKMRFQAKVFQIPIRLAALDPLFKRARRIYDIPEPPPPREGCKDCRLVERMMTVCRHNELEMLPKDGEGR